MDDWLGPKPNREECLDLHPSILKGSSNSVNNSYYGVNTPIVVEVVMAMELEAVVAVVVEGNRLSL